MSRFRSCHTRTFALFNNIIGNVVISPTSVVRDLGDLLDHYLLLRNQVSNICKSAWYIIYKE